MAMSRSWTFVPAPIFCVEPISTRMAPLRTFAKSWSFFTSVSASWMNAISSSGTPRAISLFVAGVVAAGVEVGANDSSMTLMPHP